MQAVTPVLVSVFSLFPMSTHEVCEGMIFPSASGWFASPFSFLVGLAIIAVAAYVSVPLLLKENVNPAGVAGTVPVQSAQPALSLSGKSTTDEELYETVIETMGVATLIVEEDWTISLVNNEFEKLSGFSRREIEGIKKATEFIAPESREMVSIYHAARRNDPDSVPATYKAQFIDRSGAIRDVLSSVKMIPGTKKSVVSAIDIADFKRTEAALIESEERYRTAIECSNDAITICRGDLRVYANRKFLEMFGYDRFNEAIGQPIYPVIHPQDRDRVAEIDRRRQKGEPAPARYEFRGIKKDGSVIYVEVSVAGITYRGERATLNHLRDITERTLAEDQIKTSLRQKEVLLKEVHHRIKNNLQVVSSLLYLQSQKVKDEETRRLLEESRNRVKSMAFIHKQLYHSKNVAEIDFAPYVRNLARNLLESYRTNGHGITLDVHVEDVFLPLDTAIPCGLIINELVSNALKHAFLNGSEGRIKVDLHRTGEENVLIVSDDGEGIADDIDVQNAGTLGLQLVSALSMQVGGRLELIRDKGTMFKITF